MSTFFRNFVGCQQSVLILNLFRIFWCWFPTFPARANIRGANVTVGTQFAVPAPRREMILSPKLFPLPTVCFFPSRQSEFKFFLILGLHGSFRFYFQPTGSRDDFSTSSFYTRSIRRNFFSTPELAHLVWRLWSGKFCATSETRNNSKEEKSLKYKHKNYKYSKKRF